MSNWQARICRFQSNIKWEGFEVYNGSPIETTGKNWLKTEKST